MSFSALPSQYGTPDPITANANGVLGSGAVIDAFTNVSLEGIFDDDSYYPFNLVGTFNLPADIGKAVALDTTMPNSVHLAAAGNFVLGVIVSIENRVNSGGSQVGTVRVEGGLRLPLDTTAGAILPAIGDSIQGGAIAGTVIKLAATADSRKIVTAVNLTTMTATVLFV